MSGQPETSRTLDEGGGEALLAAEQRRDARGVEHHRRLAGEDARGGRQYSSQAAAIAAINLESFVVPDNVIDAIWIASLILKKGTADLSDTGDNTIVNKQ